MGPARRKQQRLVHVVRKEIVMDAFPRPGSYLVPRNHVVAARALFIEREAYVHVAQRPNTQIHRRPVYLNAGPRAVLADTAHQSRQGLLAGVFRIFGNMIVLVRPAIRRKHHADAAEEVAVHAPARIGALRDRFQVDPRQPLLEIAAAQAVAAAVVRAFLRRAQPSRAGRKLVSGVKPPVGLVVAKGPAFFRAHHHPPGKGVVQGGKQHHFDADFLGMLQKSSQ